VTKLNIDLNTALYETPVSFLMLMIYELARMHDSGMFTLLEMEAIDGNSKSHSKVQG
jgi:hypothetical protein